MRASHPITKLLRLLSNDLRFSLLMELARNPNQTVSAPHMAKLLGEELYTCISALEHLRSAGLVEIRHADRLRRRQWRISPDVRFHARRLQIQTPDFTFTIECPAPDGLVQHVRREDGSVGG